MKKPNPFDSAESQVVAVERAFAKTMADRDLAAFESFLSDEAVFISEGSVSRGREVVVAEWKPFFEGDEAPFSWAPETVVVLESGDLAISTGPVWSAAGVRTGTYSSTWRQDRPGVWRIVFDKGERYCE
jgi:ketosteroid isomerase-like protein